MKDREKQDKFLEFQKQQHSPDLPLPLHMHVDEMKTMERSHSKAHEVEHKASIAEAFGRIENSTLIRVGQEIADKAFDTYWPDGRGKAIALCAIIPKQEYYFDTMYKSKAGGDYFEYVFNERFVCIIKYMFQYDETRKQETC